MAASMGMSGAAPASSIGGWIGRSRVSQGRRSRIGGGRGVGCIASAGGGLGEKYRTLRIQPGASEKEVKKAFRQLALQYHPDVCKGNNCSVQFHRINEAYEIVMSSLRESEDDEQEQWSGVDGDDESTRGMHDPSWDLWEEWMGWEGAGIRDYSSHINPYI